MSRPIKTPADVAFAYRYILIQLLNENMTKEKADQQIDILDKIAYDIATQ